MIAIKGLQMPMDCNSCPLYRGIFGICDHIYPTQIRGHRPPNCPLLEVKPLVASRVVDADTYDITEHQHKTDLVLLMARTLFASGAITFDAADWPRDDCPRRIELQGRVEVVMKNGWKGTGEGANGDA